MKHGDFTGLAESYARYRPGYSDSVLTALLALVAKPIAQMDAADVGAGTGIWTVMLASKGCRSVTAVEPNDDMRRQGQEVTRTQGVKWQNGSGEATGLAAASADFLSMASSFHWVDFDKGIKEFARVLRPGGRFVALWNPRLIEANPLIAETEDYLRVLCPDIKRVSSGRSGITEKLTDMLSGRPEFEDAIYMEGRHVRHQTVDEYVGAWRSVNDVQVQLGPESFERFLEHVRSRLSAVPRVEITYLTRAWAARRR
jgi:ubiquinone/menaquinone biosynthesis C-methylase UbiE